jgi:FlaA1/EpsC-like NDP-sugar epimerase/lipopolysaccharide/colanic/teichoic acid biosynthesis glycosyltransferase
VSPVDHDARFVPIPRAHDADSTTTPLPGPPQTAAGAGTRHPKEICDPYLAPLSLEKASVRRCQDMRMVPLQFLRWDPELLTAAKSGTSPLYFRALKRSVDVLAPTLFGMLLLPLVALLAILIKLDSPGPVFSNEIRLGRHGRPFRMYKFRSTSVNPGAQNAGCAALAAPCTTALGGFMRRTQIDELPQLWNVLRGDMSIVGPRPLRPQHAARIQDTIPEFSLRTAVKPGLVGWAEMAFHSDGSVRDLKTWLAYDLYYIDFHTIGMENLILFRTVKTMIVGEWLDLEDRFHLEVEDEHEPEHPAGGAHGQRDVATSEHTGRVPKAFTGNTSPLSATIRHIASIWLPGSIDNAPPRDGLQRALIVGAGAGGRIIAGELRSCPTSRLWPVGFLDDDPKKHRHRIDHLPVLGNISALPLVVRREAAEVVVIAIPSAPQATLSRVAEIARSAGAEVLTMPPINSILRGEEKLTTLRRVRPVDVLGRAIVQPDHEHCRSFIEGKRVLISGAAGSIGQEVARQVVSLKPSMLILVDINESDLFDRHQELHMEEPDVEIRPFVLSVTDAVRMYCLFAETRPQIVFHAAAYKHVPLMEAQPGEAVLTNVFGTKVLADTSAQFGVERFVLVSTDKAVRPSSAMGASKRVAEMVVSDISSHTGLSSCAVRFGNVLGSRGSVIPTFERQIEAGGPVTITDERMRRYFMTIPEASGLIIQAGAFRDDNVICMLDMGEDVPIVELAERVIRLHGLRPHVDMPIVFTGIRPGEKLREDLANDFEAARESPHPKIRMLSSKMNPDAHHDMVDRLAELQVIAEVGSPDDIRSALHNLVRWGDREEGCYGLRERTAADPALAASAY